MSWAEHLVTVHADPPSRVVRRTAASARNRAQVDRWAGYTQFAQLPDQCMQSSSIQICASRSDMLPELAWGQQDRAFFGYVFKRIHIVLRRRLPLKVPPTASRWPCR